MKRRLLTIILISLTALLFAQAPQGINYQTVVRDNAGNPRVNTNIGIKINIRYGSVSGTVVYAETHQKTTNNFGLINLVIGQGNVQTGTFSSIAWSNNTYFVETLIDANGGTNYFTVGTSQMLSVPYALYAENVAMQFRMQLSVLGSSNIDTANIYQSETIESGVAPNPDYLAGEEEDIVVSHTPYPIGISENLTYPATWTKDMFLGNVPFLYLNSQWTLTASNTATPGFYPITFTATNPRGRTKTDKFILHIKPCIFQTENSAVGNYIGKWTILVGTSDDTLSMTNPVNGDGKISIYSQILHATLIATLNGNNFTIANSAVPNNTQITTNFGSFTLQNVVLNGTGNFNCDGSVTLSLSKVSGDVLLGTNPVNLSGPILQGTFARQ